MKQPTALLIPGGHGQLGTELARHAVGGALLHRPGSAELDVTDAGSVRDAVGSFAETARDCGLPPVVINAAAYTAVDDAESDEDSAARVNADGPRELAAACREFGVPLVQLSTDYVFDGTGERPYEPGDPVGPRTAYGRTKLAGERAVLESGARAWVVRTAWLYGSGGANFVTTMARLERERTNLSVVDDQVGSPTWVACLAEGLLELAGRVADHRGPERRVLHYAGEGAVSWFGLARAVFTELGADPERVRPCGTADFPRPAARPGYSVLSAKQWCEAGLAPPRPWREALADAFARDSFESPE